MGFGTSWRRWSVPRFVERMAARHPELARQVTWRDVKAIAAREGIVLYHLRVPYRGRLVRYGERVAIQLRRDLSEKERTEVAVHELVHFWRDDPGEPAFYSDEGDTRQDKREEFADIVAWFVTTPNRPLLRKDAF